MVHADRQPIELAEEMHLTQYGESAPGEGFRDRLRVEIGETELSLICGAVDATAASLLVTRAISPMRLARMTTVRALREAGFLVVQRR